MFTKVGSDSGKFDVLSHKPFNDVFVVFVYFILFYFHKMQVGRQAKHKISTISSRTVHELIMNITAVLIIPFFIIIMPELR